MVSFDTAATLTLIVILAVTVFFNRKKLTFHRFGIFYAAMYRTKAGLKTMDKLGKKYKHIWEKLTPWIIGIGFIGMALVTFDLARSLITLLTNASAPSVGVVLPIKAKGVFYVPFVYWIISIFTILIIHEGMHGVMARAYGLRIKNSGLVVLGAVLPLIPGAFVEPDEKKLRAASKKKQLGVYAAGPVANIATGLLFMLLLFGVFNPITNTFYEGVAVTELMEGNPPAEQAGITAGDKITFVNGYPIYEPKDFTNALKGTSPGDQVNVITSNAIYDITLGENPDNSKAWLGVFVNRELASTAWFTYPIIWMEDLLYWLMLLSLGVGLFNLVPLGPIDGGRMLLATLQGVIHEKKANTIWKSVSFFVLGILMTNILLAFI